MWARVRARVGGFRVYMGFDGLGFGVQGFGVWGVGSKVNPKPPSFAIKCTMAMDAYPKFRV